MSNEQQHRFQVNLRGVIGILSNHLYSGPGVFVRELLQNSVDALHARGQIEPAFPRDAGAIEFSLIEAKDAAPTLMIEDNGVGLTEEEVHRFLATIGESSKRDDLGAAREDFIGQFGIGLLSCFMVADEIVMVTRSAKSPDGGGGGAIEWRGRPDGTYSVRRIGVEKSGAPGTRVFLRCKPGAEEFFRYKKLRELMEFYGGMLKIPLTLTTGSGGARVRTRINDRPPPWRSGGSAGGGMVTREDLLEYGRSVFKEDFFDAIPLKSAGAGGGGDVEGIAFVLTHSPSPAARQKHRLYLKNMLVAEEAQNLLPEWAFFVRCVLNANRLRPTASRESFYDDEALEQTREDLGQCLRRWLLNMAARDPERLTRFIAIHYVAIKSLAVHDDEFYRLFINMLPFETSRGYTTLEEYRRENPKVVYAETVDQFRQIAGIANAQGLCVINAGYTFDRQLLERLTEFFPDTTVEEIDAESLTQTFEELTLAEHDACFELLQAADRALQASRCEAEVRRFEPVTLPALYNVSDRGRLFRSTSEATDASDGHWSGLLSSALGDTGKSAYARLCFNYSNSLIQRLTRVADKTLLRRLVELVYVQALLAGHHPLATHEMKMLNDGLLDLINLAAGEDPAPPASGKRPRKEGP